MSEQEEATLQRLLAHEGWLRTLARALVAEGSSGDDLAQETWARVLERPPPSVDSPRAWLASIVRRVAGERRRDERARARREQAAAAERGAAHEDPAWAERIEAAARLQQRVARAMLALSEPGRSTVVLRYFEGRSSAQIARETGVPDSTVRNRLRRALAELREILDRESGGDGRQWLTALLPLADLAPRPEPAAVAAGGSSLLGGALAMGIATKCTAALVFLGAALLLLQRNGLFPWPPTPAARMAAEPAAPLAAAGERSIPGDGMRRFPAAPLGDAGGLALAPGDADPASPAQGVEPSLQARLAGLAQSFLTEEPDFRGLDDLLVAIVREAEVSPTSIQRDESSGAISGKLELGALGQGDFQLEGSSCRLVLVGSWMQDPTFPLQFMTLSSSQVGGTTVNLQIHPDTRRPPAELLGEREEVTLGWSLTTNDQGLEASRHVGKRGDSGPTSWMLGSDREKRDPPQSAIWGLGSRAATLLESKLRASVR